MISPPVGQTRSRDNVRLTECLRCDGLASADLHPPVCLLTLSVTRNAYWSRSEPCGKKPRRSPYTARKSAPCCLASSSPCLTHQVRRWMVVRATHAVMAGKTQFEPTKPCPTPCANGFRVERYIISLLTFAVRTRQPTCACTKTGVVLNRPDLAWRYGPVSVQSHYSQRSQTGPQNRCGP